MKRAEGEQPGVAPEFDRRAVEAISDPLDRLRVIMKRLLDPGGCPWDREQTHQTLKQYLIEEAHEVCEAIDNGDDDEFCEELGDLALQVVFHAELAERAGRFRFEDACEAICRKLIDRHPHVFGDAVADDSEAVLLNWERIKKEERRRKAERKGGSAEEVARVSAIDGVPASLPSLLKARRLQSKAAKVGFDWDGVEGVIGKVREELAEFLAEVVEKPDPARLQDEFGDLLFSLVNLSRFIDVRPDDALQSACRKFARRFRAVELAAAGQGRDLREMTLAEMDALWDKAKLAERDPE